MSLDLLLTFIFGAVAGGCLGFYFAALFMAGK
jgi:hypothetical protein